MSTGISCPGGSKVCKNRRCCASVIFLCAALSVFGASAGATPFSRFFARKEKEILARMTLDEKVGQLLVFGFQGKTLDGDFEKWLASGRLGNIKIFLRNVEGRAQVKELTRRVVELEKGSRNGIPPFIATDMEGGTVNHVRYPGIRLAPAAGLVGATGEAESARISSRLIALTLSDIGVNMNFAPCADVLTEPRNMVIMTRSYGSDPELVSRMVKAFVEEHTKAGILPVMKHFPGHGMTGFDSHVVSDKVDVSRAQMMKVHLLPYERLIREKVIHACMTAHIIYSELDPEHPATFSRKIIDGLLRNELGFDGLVVTDELEMEGAAGASKGIVESFVSAFQAGNDLFLVGHTKEKEEKLIESIPGLFKDGTLSVKELDGKVLRVLAAKKRFLRVFYGPAVPSDATSSSNKTAAGKTGKPSFEQDYQQAADENRAMAEKGIVLISSRVKEPIPQYLKGVVDKKKKGVILSPTEGFGGLAKKYLPDWDVVSIGYHPEEEKVGEKIAASKEKLSSYGIALIGFSGETHGEWVEACRDAKLPFFILSIENPFAAGRFSDQALFVVAAFGPNSPGTDALFSCVFVTGRFSGRFPYDL